MIQEWIHSLSLQNLPVRKGHHLSLQRPPVSIRPCRRLPRHLRLPPLSHLHFILLHESSNKTNWGWEGRDADRYEAVRSSRLCGISEQTNSSAGVTPPPVRYWLCSRYIASFSDFAFNTISSFRCIGVHSSVS